MIARSDHRSRRTIPAPRVPAGGYYVVASHEGDATKRSLSFFELHASDTREEDLKLSKEFRLAGTVRGPDGEALAGARIIARSVLGEDGLGYHGRGDLETRSDGDGTFVLSGLTKGSCRLNVWLDGFYNPDGVGTKYEIPRSEHAVVEMIGTGSIRGTLVRRDGGQMNVSLHPPGGNKVGSWGGSANCGESGSFEFRNVPVGEYLIGPTGGGDFKEGDAGVRKIKVERGKATVVDLGK